MSGKPRYYTMVCFKEEELALVIELVSRYGKWLIEQDVPEAEEEFHDCELQKTEDLYRKLKRRAR